MGGAPYIIFLGSIASAAGPELTLDEAIDAAIHKTRSVVQAREDLLLVDVEQMRALSNILPKLDAYFTGVEDFWGNYVTETRSRVPVPPQFVSPEEEQLAKLSSGPFIDVVLPNNSAPFLNLRLSGRQLIYDGGRWWTVIARVSDLRELREAQLKAIESDARQAVVNRFYSYAKSVEAVGAVREQVRLSQAQLTRARSRLSAGRAKKTDVATAERNLASDRVALARRRYDLGVQRRALNLAMGRDPNIDFTLRLPDRVATSTRTPPVLSLREVDDLQELGVKSRAEVATQEANLRQLWKNIDIAEADFWPVFALIANYWRGPSRRPDRIFADPTDNYHAQVGLEVRWNLFNGRATQAAVEQAEINARRHIATIEDIKRSVRREVADRRANIDLAYEVFKLARRGHVAAEEAVRLAEGLYRQGKSTALELRDAELRLTQARLSLMEARFDIEIAKENLRRALGVEELADAMRGLR